MRPVLCFAVLVPFAVHAERRPIFEPDLGQKVIHAGPDRSLAGDLSHPPEAAGPKFKEDPAVVSLQAQVESKREEQIADLKKLLQLETRSDERAQLLFHLGELYFEQTRYLATLAWREPEGARRDALLAESHAQAELSIAAYRELVTDHRDFAHADQALYLMGLTLAEQGDVARQLVVYKRLIAKYPHSPYVPDAQLAFGDFYFSQSHGKRELLERALQAYQAAGTPYASYKEGWCHYNLGAFDAAIDAFRRVIQLPGAKAQLVSEARSDLVRSYAQRPDATREGGRALFAPLAPAPDVLRAMMTQLGNLLFDEGKDTQAALIFDALIKDRLDAPEVPALQAKIIECVMRAGNKQMTVRQVDHLVTLTKGNKADSLAERILSNLAVNWHKECRSTRDDGTCALASRVYADYLALFPDNAKAYELRFFWAELLFEPLHDYAAAAEQYSLVFGQDIARGAECDKAGACKRKADAAYDAILAFKEVTKTLPPPKLTDPTAKLELPTQVRSLLGACERYLKHVPAGEKWVDVEWEAAHLSYDYNDLERAIPKLVDLALNHCSYQFPSGQKPSELAIHLVLDSYNLLGDCAQVSAWARRFSAEAACISPVVKAELAELTHQSTFACIEKLAPRRDCKIPEAYLGFAAEFPAASQAQTALFNAGVGFSGCHSLDRAIGAWKQLVDRYPSSDLVPRATFAVGEQCEATADFACASDSYERYAGRYERARKKPGTQRWEESKAQLGLFNAGILRDGLGDARQALADRQKYLDLWPNAADADAVFLSIVDLQERANHWAQAVRQLELFVKRRATQDPDRALIALGKIAGFQEQRLESPRDARKTFDRILESWERLPKTGRDKLSPGALEVVARAHLAVGEDRFRKFDRLSLKWSRFAHPEELRASISEKARALSEVQQQTLATLAFKAADPGACALQRLGTAYDHFADALSAPPIPADAPEALRDQLRFGREGDQLREKATEAFRAAAADSTSASPFNPCRQAALDWLQSHSGDRGRAAERPELKLNAPRPVELGDDVLTAIQL
jgi:TolA-binding protein